MSVYVYIRVSSKDQKEDRQQIALKEVGVELQNIYVDKQSGKDFNRPQYKKMLRKLKKTICSTSRALTVLGATMKKSCSNGGYLPKKKASTLWYWICPCLIPVGEKTLWVLSSPTLFCRFCHSLQKMSVPTSSSVKPRA